MLVFTKYTLLELGVGRTYSASLRIPFSHTERQVYIEAEDSINSELAHFCTKKQVETKRSNV